MFKKGLLALTLVFSLPVFAAEHWIDVRVPEQYQQEHVQGAINIPHYLHPHRLFASAHKYAFSLVKNDFLRD